MKTEKNDVKINIGHGASFFSKLSQTLRKRLKLGKNVTTLTLRVRRFGTGEERKLISFGGDVNFKVTPFQLMRDVLGHRYA